MCELNRFLIGGYLGCDKMYFTEYIASAGSLFGKAKEARYLTKTATKALLHPLHLLHVFFPLLLQLLELLRHIVFLPFGLLQLWSQQLDEVLPLFCLFEHIIGLQ